MHAGIRRAVQGISAAVRFDDSLDTVLAADMTGPVSAEWAWRQLVDLIGRGRASARPDAIERLRAIRGQVPRPARLAAARGLERADPPAALVALFVDDELAIAGPVVRSARLTSAEWVALLPRMRPATRGVLRLRRDLSEQVAGALAAFGPNDFALHGLPGEPVAANDTAVGESAGVAPVSELGPPAFVPPESDPFVAVAEVVRELPVVVQAIRRADASKSAPSREDFEIASLVARIEAHQRATDGQPAPAPRAPASAPDQFRFETDTASLIRWVEGIDRSPLIGLSLTAGRDGAPASVDGVVAGALAHRTRFANARLEVGGASEAAGSWRISAAPVFDRTSGRFTGYRGVARRPRADEAPGGGGAVGGADALRQLVHELRTPANAISGFAEMIEHQLLGPVPTGYREQAAAIRGQTVGLLDAIEDLDVAARLESRGLDLRNERVELAPLLARISAQLDPLVRLRGARLVLEVEPDVVAAGDAPALDRLLSRFLTALVAGAAADETIAGRVERDGAAITLTIARPAGFVASTGGLFEADAEAEAAIEGGPLLGTGFGFRLARRLAGELGGSLAVEPATLTLRLPAAVERSVEQATI